jgi:hypothetical protein
MHLGVFEFVIALVILGTVSSIITGGLKIEREKIRARSRGMDGETEQLHGIVGNLHQDVAKLKDRVRVLEKLVTDDDRRLADEIERLKRTDSTSRI